MNKKTLTRADLTESLHRSIGLSRTESADMVNAVLDLVADALVDGQTVNFRHLALSWCAPKGSAWDETQKPAKKCQLRHVVCWYSGPAR